MSRVVLASLALVAAVASTTTTVLHAQQIPLPTTAAQVPGPAKGSAMTKPYVPAPNGPFSLYIRAYWADKPILDGQWKPPVVTRVQ